MIMKVILREDMDSLGFEGDVVDVAKGYGRNYLIPKGLALEANKQNRQLIEMQRKKIEVKRVKAKDDAERVKEKIAEVVITIRQKAGEEDKLYGSVTTMDIAACLEEKGVAIDRKKLILDKPIKALGEYEIPVKLHPVVTGTVKVIVKPEEQPETE
jgi:large subunit ribosomal protein L9